MATYHPEHVEVLRVLNRLIEDIPIPDINFAKQEISDILNDSYENSLPLLDVAELTYRVRRLERTLRRY